MDRPLETLVEASAKLNIHKSEWIPGTRRITKAPVANWRFFPCVDVWRQRVPCDVVLDVAMPSLYGEVFRVPFMEVQLRCFCWCPPEVSTPSSPTSKYKSSIAALVQEFAAEPIGYLSVGEPGVLGPFPRGLGGVRFIVQSPWEQGRVFETSVSGVVDPSWMPPRNLDQALQLVQLSKNLDQTQLLPTTPSTKIKQVALLAALNPSAYDGMQKMILEQAFADVPNVSFTIVDVACRGHRLNGTQIFHDLVDKNVTVEYHCLQLDNLPYDQGKRELHRGMWLHAMEATSPQHLSPLLQPILTKLYALFQRFDAVLAVHLQWYDLYILRIARWANPNILRVLHLGSKFSIHPRFWKLFDTPALHKARGLEPDGEASKLDFGGPVPVDEEFLMKENPISLRGMLRREGRSEMEFFESVELVGPLRNISLPVDVLLAPSVFVASQPEVQAVKLPIRVVITGLDTERKWNPEIVEENSILREKARKLLGGGGEPLLVGTVARISPEKGLGVLLRAFIRVLNAFVMAPRKDGREPVLVIAGSAKDDAMIHMAKSQAAALGIAHRVLWVGFLPPHEIPSLIRTLDILVCMYTNPRGETFGLSAAEGMAMGRPVLLYGAGGTGDFAIPHKTAIVPSTASIPSVAYSLEMALRNDTTRTQLGATAREFAVQHLDQSKWVKELYNLYHHPPPLQPH